MHDLECLFLFRGCLLGYVGLGPGPELIPYFLALLSVVGAALIAVLQWPITAFWAYLSRIRRRDDGQQNPQRLDSGSSPGVNDDA